MVVKSKKRNQITALLVMSALIVALVLPLASQPKPHFTDVPTTHWAYANIERAYSDGVMAGTGGNAAKYTGVFSPSGTLTEAQFVTILTRGFFPTELEAAKKSIGSNAKWYAAAEKVAEDKNLLTFVQGKMDKPITRYDMAAIIANVMDAKEFAGRPDFNTVQATFSKIADINSIPDSYQTSVAAVFAMGIITGTDSKGTFSGSSYMNRAQAAVVYGRMKDAFLNYNGSSKPSTPTEPTAPSKPSTGDSSSIVGTVSSSPVTLSYATHKPTVDFWSNQSDTVKNASDKDTFNAAIDTIIHAKDISAASVGKKYSVINDYYNYAVFGTDDMNKLQGDTSLAATGVFMNGYKFGTDKKNGCWIFNAVQVNDAIKEAVSPATSKFTSGMSDKEKIKICVDLVTSKFSYGAGQGGFSWTSGTTGVCNDFANATLNILDVAGIPCFMVSGTVSNGAHSWVQAYADGEWIIVDSTAAEYGYSQYMSFSEHERLYGYNHSTNEGTRTLIRRAIVESVVNAG